MGYAACEMRSFLSLEVYKSGLVATRQDTLEGVTTVLELLPLASHKAPSTSETLGASDFTGVAQSCCPHWTDNSPAPN